MRGAIAAALLALGTLRAGPDQAADELALRAVRFYRADHRRTRVTVFLEIPWGLVQPADRSNRPPSYEVVFRLADSSGATLHTQSWRAPFPAAARQPGGCAVETVEFVIRAGRYRLEATVRDSGSGRESHAGLDLEGFDAAPTASDLLLSPGIRPVAAADTVPRSGELRRGSVLITASALLRLTPSRSTAFFLLEAYGPSDRAEEGSMVVSVRSPSGAPLLRFRPMAVRLQPGGSVLRGQVNLAGLEPGRYLLAVSVTLPGRTVEREAEFLMERDR